MLEDPALQFCTLSLGRYAEVLAEGLDVAILAVYELRLELLQWQSHQLVELFFLFFCFLQRK